MVEALFSYSLEKYYPLDYRNGTKDVIVIYKYRCFEKTEEMLTVLDVTANLIYGDSKLDDLTRSISEENHQR